MNASHFRIRILLVFLDVDLGFFVGFGSWFFSDSDAWNFFGLDSLASLGFGCLEFVGLDLVGFSGRGFLVAFLRSWIGLVRRHHVFFKVLMNAGAFRRIRIRRFLLDLDFVRC